jgi:hypothetical protein
MRLIVGFGSKARQGKDSAAYAIQDYARRFSLPDVRIFKFAAALYQECEEHHGMIGKDAPLLQRVGQARREQNENYWVDRLRFSMGNFKGIALITDVRYKNEANWIRDSGGFLVNVTRLNEDGTPFIATDRPADHPSEIELDNYNWDAYIKTKTNQQAMAAEIAITQFNYFYELTRAEAAQWA